MKGIETFLPDILSGFHAVLRPKGLSRLKGIETSDCTANVEKYESTPVRKDFPV